MKISEVLVRDPSRTSLANQGQARLDSALSELKEELSTFVCEAQYADGLYRIIESYLKSLQHSSQKGAWVSGFYGSGKSHFLKMLCHLWQNTIFPDGATARTLVPNIPDDLRALLRELDVQARRTGGLVAVAGSLPSGATELVRLTILGIILKGVELPSEYVPAKFVLWLREHGLLAHVRAAVEAAGKQFERELGNLYVSPIIARALIEADPAFAPTEAQARQTIRAQFPPQTTDISTEEFLRMAKDALLTKSDSGRLPCTVVVLDEVQQYIGDSNERSTLVTEVAEALSKQMDSKVIVVAAGQSALHDASRLEKLIDRFKIAVPLSDADVETVTRRVVLQKKADKLTMLRESVDINSPEVSRQLAGTRIAHIAGDTDVFLDDYPLLPVRRRFWEECFRVLDAAGTKSQLRSQLHILHDALAKIADKPLGAVVPADELYDALAPAMVETSVLSRDINERIINQSKDGSPDAILARRICGLVFLVGRLNEKRADLGVRARPDHIADLLVDDINTPNTRLRSDVERVIEKLVNDGVLMPIGDEVRIQTREGAEWDREFRAKQARLRNDEATLHARQQTLLRAEIDNQVRSLRILHGAGKQKRDLVQSFDHAPPVSDGESIPVWIRDGWSGSETEVVNAARAAGLDSAVIFVFINTKHNDLRRLVIDAEAAKEVIDQKGIPSTGDAFDAYSSMVSRRNEAMKQLESVVSELVRNAKVFQGGGREMLQADFSERLRAAAEASLTRLFPQFSEADAPGPAWDTAIKRAREGADQPFAAVGYNGPTEQHPVCKRVIAAIGSGASGTQIEKTLSRSPYGWSREAVNAALIALHRIQHITATLNGVPIAPGQLDQTKTKKAEFRVERATLTPSDRLKVRGLFQLLDITCKKDEELVKADEFLVTAIALARAAGGDGPLPIPPTITQLEDLRRLTGNERLAAIAPQHEELRSKIEEWKKTKEAIERRLDSWRAVERMAAHAAALPTGDEIRAQVDAIRENRMLLAPTDPVAALRVRLAGELRDAMRDAVQAHESEWQSALQTLEASGLWKQLSAEDRSAILRECQLSPLPSDDVSSDDALLASLDRLPIARRRAETDAIRSRATRALSLAAKKLEPKVRAITIERATLRTKDDVIAWSERQKTKLIDALADGPVLID